MELHFHSTNGPADEAIDHLIGLVGDVYHPEIVREMILAALKAGQEGSKRADLKLMNSTLKEMRFTTKVFGRYRHVRKVSVFGSSRTQPHEVAYKMAPPEFLNPVWEYQIDRENVSILHHSIFFVDVKYFSLHQLHLNHIL